ncbi:MAG: ribonuclease HI [Christensenellales bacterium]
MEEKLLDVDLYTDGACSGNPGKGGWGYLLICQSRNKEKYDSGFKEHTTNNEMELTAVIEGIKAIKKPCNLTIYTDSAYVSNAFLQNWIESWINNGFKNSSKKEIANKDLWLKLLSLLEKHNYKWVKVKGHADNKNNNFCDKLATTAIKENTEQKTSNSLGDKK